MTTTTLPKVGDRIIVRVANGLINTKYIGTEQHVTDVGEGTYYLPGDGVRTGYGAKVFFRDGETTYYTTEWDIVEPLADATQRTVGADNVTIPANPTPDELIQIIERCSNDLATVKARRTETEQRLQDVDERFRRSIDIIGQRLLQEAEDRGWCDSFDSIIDEVNSQLPFYELPTREEEYEVTVSVSGYIRTTTSVMVMARSQDAANDMVAEDVHSYVDADDVLTDAARNESFDDIECEVE